MYIITKRKPESIINKEVESVIKNFPTSSVPEGFTGFHRDQVSINIPILKHSLIEVL